MYRIVVMERERQTKGKPVEILGSYDPHNDVARLRTERIQYWIEQGARPSPTVHNILIEEKVITGEKCAAWKPKKKSAEELEKEAKEKAEQTEEKPAEA